jgi:hypothetical protein
VSAECPRNLFTSRSDELAVAAQIASEASGANASECSPDIGVREPSATLQRHEERRNDPKRPAHPSNRLVAQLNANWRVVDDPLQWILQRRKGNPRKKNTGWRSRSFCRTRGALLCCIREYCCLPDHGALRCIEEYRGVDAAALQQIRALPEWHIDCTALSGDDPALASDETQR